MPQPPQALQTIGSVASADTARHIWNGLNQRFAADKAAGRVEFGLLPPACQETQWRVCIIPGNYAGMRAAEAFAEGVIYSVGSGYVEPGPLSDWDN